MLLTSSLILGVCAQRPLAVFAADRLRQVSNVTEVLTRPIIDGRVVTVPLHAVENFAQAVLEKTKAITDTIEEADCIADAFPAIINRVADTVEESNAESTIPKAVGSAIQSTVHSLASVAVKAPEIGRQFITDLAAIIPTPQCPPGCSST